MKQIDIMQKKTYVEPKLKIINVDQTDIICASGDPEPYDFDGELD